MAANTDPRELRETVADVLANHPVTVGFLFGSHARGDAGARSDIHVAVAFEESDSGQFRARLRLGTDLALALGRDDIDVVDLRSASPALVRAVFRDGERLVGSDSDAQRVREQALADADEDSRSPAQRFDDALSAIDDHLA